MEHEFVFQNSRVKIIFGSKDKLNNHKAEFEVPC